MQPMKMMSQSQISINSAMTKSMSPAKYKVKSHYRGIFRGKRKLRNFDSNTNITVAKRGRDKRKKQAKIHEERRGTIFGGLQHQTSSTIIGEFVQRQFTIDQQKTYHPILQNDSGGQESARLVGTTQFGMSIYKQTTFGSLNQPGSSSKLNLTMKQQDLLNVSKIPVRGKERTRSFINKLPEMVRQTIKADKNTNDNDKEGTNPGDKEARDENFGRFLGLIQARRESMQQSRSSIFKPRVSLLATGGPSLVPSAGNSLLATGRPSLIKNSAKRGSFMQRGSKRGSIFQNNSRRGSIISLHTDDSPLTSIEDEEDMDQINEEDEKDENLKEPSKDMPYSNSKTNKSSDSRVKESPNPSQSVQSKSSKPSADENQNKNNKITIIKAIKTRKIEIPVEKPTINSKYKEVNDKTKDKHFSMVSPTLPV